MGASLGSESQKIHICSPFGHYKINMIVQKKVINVPFFAVLRFHWKDIVINPLEQIKQCAMGYHSRKTLSGRWSWKCKSTI